MLAAFIGVMDVAESHDLNSFSSDEDEYEDDEEYETSK